MLKDLSFKIVLEVVARQFSAAARARVLRALLAAAPLRDTKEDCQ
jgi:hypothetical protein